MPECHWPLLHYGETTIKLHYLVKYRPEFVEFISITVELRDSNLGVLDFIRYYYSGSVKILLLSFTFFKGYSSLTFALQNDSTLCFLVFFCSPSSACFPFSEVRCKGFGNLQITTFMLISFETIHFSYFPNHRTLNIFWRYANSLILNRHNNGSLHERGQIKALSTAGYTVKRIADVVKRSRKMSCVFRKNILIGRCKNN
uniref:Uncharacterized protein n=1 Tax=Heterorhabditis bacteriophora TaxID=37862 RepID=A0A1I7W6L3_HETBA